MRVHHIIKSMTKRFSVAFTTFSILVFTFLIVWFVFRTINTRSDNLLAAEDELDLLTQKVSSAYLASDSFSSEYFENSITGIIKDSFDLQALVVSTKSDGIGFVYATAKDYLPAGFDFSKNTSVPIVFSINPVTEEIVSTTAIMPEGKDLRLDTVYTVLAREEMFPIVRELLIGLLSFLLIIAVLIIIQPILASKVKKAVIAGEVLSPDSRKNEEELSATPPDASNIPEAEKPEHDLDMPVHTETKNRHDERSVSVPAAAGLYSPKTELGWEEYLEERLSAELKRAASFDQDLVLLLGCVTGLKRSDPFYQQLSQMAQEFFNFQDLCFEYHDGGIGIIIPNVDIDDGIERVESFKNRIDRHLIEDGIDKTLSVGLSARNGRLISGKRIIREAKSALRRAEKESSGIIAFRVDPEKYRDYIASRKSTIQR